VIDKNQIQADKDGKPRPAPAGNSDKVPGNPPYPSGADQGFVFYEE